MCSSGSPRPLAAGDGDEEFLAQFPLADDLVEALRPQAEREPLFLGPLAVGTDDAFAWHGALYEPVRSL